MFGKRLASTTLALLWAASAAHADELMLRLRLNPAGTPQAGYELLHAQVGSFGESVEAGASRSGDLIVVGRDAAGRELFRRQFRNPSRHTAEVFSPETGKIQIARPIEIAGIAELRLPHPAALKTLDLLEAPAAREGRVPLAERTPLKRISRQELDLLLSDSAKPGRQALRAGLNPSAVPSGATKLWNGGPAMTRMDIVLIGDGYTSAEMGKWSNDAQTIANAILADPLFAANKTSINITRVDIASPVSGISEGGVTRDSALGTVLGCFNVDRMVCADEAKVAAAVAAVMAPNARDVILVVANTQSYGGSGGNIAAITTHPQMTEIALHEIGHTAFKLADEYVEERNCAINGEPSEPNVTLASTRGSAKWASLISASTAVPTQPGSYPNGTVGLFQGGKYCGSGVYRPTEDSRMRSLGQPWHAVNEARARQVFANYLSSGHR